MGKFLPKEMGHKAMRLKAPHPNSQDNDGVASGNEADNATKISREQIRKAKRDMKKAALIAEWGHPLTPISAL
jgi:hypothetical protein